MRSGIVTAARLSLAAAAIAFALVPLGQALADQVQTQLAGNPDKGRTVFADAGCGGCHTLADAGAAGPIGPSFDHDKNLSEDLVVSRVSNGQGSMPPFAGQLSNQEIADVAAYVVKVAKR